MTDSDLAQDHTPLLADASDGLRRVLEQRFVPLHLAGGDTLFDQGDHDDRLYILDGGTLEVSVLSASGRKLSLNRLQPGSVFGEIALFDPGPRTARVEALTASTLRYIRQATLFDGIAGETDLVAELLRLAGRRMRWMSRQMEDQVFLPPAARLAARLLHLAGSGQEIGMSQAQLADYVGVTREVVSKTLAEWRRDGLVEVSRGRIALCDRDGLLRIKNFDFV